MAPRAIASGTISFGLVSIPVKMFPSTSPGRAISFNLLDPDTKQRVKQQYVNPETQEVVPRDKLIKGYEVAKGQYVTFTKEELKAVEAQSTGHIEIEEFVPLDLVDPVYFDKAYYLGPDKGAGRAYNLLREALSQTGLSAIAKYAARGKSYLVLMRPVADGIILQQLYNGAEVRALKDVGIDEEAEVKATELQLAVQLIQQAASKTFDPDKYSDEVRERIEALIQQKVAGEDITTAPSASPKAQVIDLMEALKASLTPDAEGEAGDAARKGPKKKATKAKSKAKSKGKAKASGK